MGCFSPDAPAARDYGKETRDTLNAQIALNPALASANLTALNRMLLGSNGQPGLIETYTGTVAPALQASTETANRSQREADIADVAALGPEARAAILAANPDNARILDLLNQQAITGLEAGTSLTADEARQAQQASRAAFAARGLSSGNQAIADELLSQFNMGQQLLRQRQAFAGNVVGLNSSTFDPMFALTGRASSAATNAPAWANGMLETSQFYNPESGYAGNLYNANQQMAAMFAEPSTIEKVGAVTDMAGRFIGSVAGAMI